MSFATLAKTYRPDATVVVTPRISDSWRPEDTQRLIIDGDLIDFFPSEDAARRYAERMIATR